MNNITKKSWAVSKSNGEFICFDSYSGYRSTSLDADAKHCVLLPTATDKEIGLAVLNCLNKSNFLIPGTSAAKVFTELGSAAKRYEKWVQDLMVQFNYSSRQKLFKSMNSCSIERSESDIIIKPSNHEKLESWSGDDISELDYVCIPSNSSPEQIGTAWRRALDRCKH